MSDIRKNVEELQAKMLRNVQLFLKEQQKLGKELAQAKTVLNRLEATPPQEIEGFPPPNVGDKIKYNGYFVEVEEVTIESCGGGSPGFAYFVTVVNEDNSADTSYYSSSVPYYYSSVRWRG